VQLYLAFSAHALVVVVVVVAVFVVCKHLLVLLVAEYDDVVADALLFETDLSCKIGGVLRVDVVLHECDDDCFGDETHDDDVVFVVDDIYFYLFFFLPLTWVKVV